MAGDSVADVGEDAVRTARLVLEPMSVELMRLVVAAAWPDFARLLGAPFPPEWRQDGWAWLHPRIAEGERDPALLIWGTRIARRCDPDGLPHGPVIAEAGFHGPPGADGWVEIGYRVAVEHQRQGYAEEAARGLIAWAARHGVAGVRASVSPTNAASRALVAKLGFESAGARSHEILGEHELFRLVSSTNRP